MFPPSLDGLVQFFVAPVQKSVDSDISGSAVEQSLEFDLCLLRCHLEYAEDAHALDCNVTFEVCLFHQVYIVIIINQCRKGEISGDIWRPETTPGLRAVFCDWLQKKLQEHLNICNLEILANQDAKV